MNSSGTPFGNEEDMMRTLQLAVEENNLKRFLSVPLSKLELLNLRFKHSLNVL